MREETLEKKIKKYVEDRGGLFLKWVSPGYTGVPDRILLMPGGRISFVEVKRPGTRDGMSARQKRVACLLRGLGFTVIRAASLDDVRKEVIG